MAKLKDLKELFTHELKDVASAEAQLMKALPKMAKAAKSPELREAFEQHLEETRRHYEMVAELLEEYEGKSAKKKCKGMEGIVEEGEEMIKERAAPAVHEAALIASAQKVEHYEIATYGTLRAWAELMEDDNAVRVLSEILDEEKATDEKLSQIAMGINPRAEEGEEEEGSRRSSSSRRSGASSRSGGAGRRRSAA